jgi:NitT/TauT family transport system substrate-binding protein
MKKVEKSSLIILGLIVMITVIAGCVNKSDSTPNQLKHITLMMNYFPMEEYAAPLVAQDKGFFAEEGLDVEIIEGKGSTVSATVVAAGDADFGLCAAPTVLISRTKEMPLKVIGIIHQETPTAAIFRKSSGIKSPKDFEGKTIASELQSTKHQQFIAFCRKNGVDTEKITFVPTSGDELPLLLSEKVDVALRYGHEVPAMLKAKGFSPDDFEIMYMKDYGLHFYNNAIIARDDTLKNNPDTAKKFVKALSKGWEYTIAHPEEAIDIFVKHYPEMDKATYLDNLKALSPLLENEVTKEHCFGYQTQERWEYLQNMLYDVKVIENKIDLSTVYTNDYTCS